MVMRVASIKVYTALRELLVVGFVAPLVGESVEPDVYVRHCSDCPCQLVQADARAIREYRFVGTEQQVHRDACLQQADDVRTRVSLHPFQFTAEFVDICIHGSYIAFEPGHFVSGLFKRGRQGIELDRLPVEAVTDAGTDRGTNDEADRPAGGCADNGTCADADVLLFRCGGVGREWCRCGQSDRDYG
jgi:hypothetical protein